MNCEAGSVYPHRARLEEANFTLCFNDYKDLMVAARVGNGGRVRQIAGYNTKEDDTRVRQVSWAIFEIIWGRTKNRQSQEIEDPTRARMKMTRVCIYHVGQEYASKSPGIVGECLAVMSWECMKYQVDVIAGDGNKACYFTTPKNPGVPTYEHSLIQFWINRMMNVATQARRKHFDPNCPPVRCKHFISCSYLDLQFLETHLEGITTETYSEELAKKTHGKGDCCMLTIVEWGHASVEYEENVVKYPNEDERNHVGEFKFRVNEICLHGNHEVFMIGQNDNDSHNPILVHLVPSDMGWKEQRQYVPFEAKIQSNQDRKERQKQNKRKGYQDQSWQQWDDQDRRRGSSSSSSYWRPK